jgi:hypothetical protein
MKAIEIRAVAQTVGNPVARRDLLSLAERFERLAEQIDIWVAQPDPLAESRAEHDKR